MAFIPSAFRVSIAATAAIFATSCGNDVPHPLVASPGLRSEYGPLLIQRAGQGKCPETDDCPASAEYWGRSCYSRARAFVGAAQAIWAPKNECLKAAPDAAEQQRHDAFVSDEVYSELSPWSSSDPWPDGLTIVLARRGKGGPKGEYGINVYRDGTAYAGSLRCPYRQKTRALSTKRFGALKDAFVDAHFMNLPVCNELVSDSFAFAVGFSDGSTRKVVYSTDASVSFPTWRLAQIIDDAVSDRPPTE